MAPRPITDSHRRSLEDESGISPEIVAEMGVWTASTNSELAELGFPQRDMRPPALVFPVLTWAGEGTPAYHRIKPDKPRTDAKGKARKYEQPVGQGCRVYCLPTARRLIERLQGVADGPQPALEYIFVTEGEKKAAALVSQGLAALAISGVWNFKNVDALRGDWDLIGLKGQKVCIVFDSDAATNEHVRKAEDRVAEMLKAMGALVHVCRLPEGPDGAKTGADDFFVRGGTVDELEALIEEHRPGKPDVKPSAAEDLIRLGVERATLWHDANRDPFATIPLAKGGFDNLPIRGKRFREWLAGVWYRSGKGAPPKEAVDRAIEMLAAQAVYDGEERQTAMRVGHAEGAVYVDLCDVARRIVRVTANGWDFVPDDASPIRFIRPKHAGALPEPTRGGDMRALADLLSTDRDGLQAIQAFMVSAYMPPPGGFPILVVNGEQGSGKSFGCRVVRGVLDPSALALRRAPKDQGDLGAALNSGYMLAFDNLSGVPGWLSDDLCSLATGGGLAKRALYSDADEHVVTGRRPVLLNGINDVVVAPDLAERCIFVEFTRPADADRRTEEELQALLEREHGVILGALLDQVSRALRDRKCVQPPGCLPRLADFAVWVYAGTPEDERGDMWSVLAENRRTKNLATVEEDALASAVRTLAEDGGFEGTAQEMLPRLNQQEGIAGPKDRPEGWPTSATALGKRLKRLKTVLAGVGVEILMTRGKQRIWTIALKGAEEATKATEATAVGPVEPEPGPIPDDAWQHCSDASSAEATAGFRVDSNLFDGQNDAYDPYVAWVPGSVDEAVEIEL